MSFFCANKNKYCLATTKSKLWNDNLLINQKRISVTVNQIWRCNPFVVDRFYLSIKVFIEVALID